MFYSHQLLARKAPLGQIWMAATMHTKMNRRKLDKLNIINICDEILNPSVPMALRLSGILMGGVVIVYDRKVKLFYEDVARFLVEINEAWKGKTIRDPTILPKGKSQAKFEDVTLPDNQPTDLGDLEERGFHNIAYNEMKLDRIDEAYISHNLGQRDLPQDHHQANIDDITMCDKFDLHQTEAGPFNHFERFDIDGDEETQANSPFHDHTDIPSSPVPSRPPQDEPQIQNPDKIHEQHPGELPNHQVSDEDKAQYNSPKRRKPTRRTGRRITTTLMDHGQTIISGPMYQSWLQNTSDIVSRRGQKRKLTRNNTCSVKIARLMDLPPVANVCGLVGDRNIYYPHPILELWTKSIQPLHDSPSGDNSSPHRPAPSPSPSPHTPAPSPSPHTPAPSPSPHTPAPSPSSHPERNNYHDPISPPFEVKHGEVRSKSLRVSTKNIRANIGDTNEVMPPPSPMKKSTTNHVKSGVSVSEINWGAVTPLDSARGDDVKSMPNTEFATHGPDVNSGRSNKKRPFSSTRRSGSNLELAAEELLENYPDPVFKVSGTFSRKRKEILLSEKENDLLVETGTGPTQTQKDQIPDDPVEQLTDSIRRQLKMHFDSPGSAQTESLNQLAVGLNRKAAAGLFYQTCVMATRDFIRVEQEVAYGDILISRGAKM